MNPSHVRAAGVVLLLATPVLLVLAISTCNVEPKEEGTPAANPSPTPSPSSQQPPGSGTGTGAGTTPSLDAAGNVGDAGNTESGTGAPPTLGAHVLGFHRYDVGIAPLVLPAMTTAATGSTIVISIGRGDWNAFSMTTTDNKNTGPFPQLGVKHAYTNWPTSGTALYARTNSVGGAGHVITSNTPPNDELTAGAVEVLNGSVVKDFQWNEVLSGQPLKSLSVTTTGPATLVAYWWGDAGVNNPKTAVPNNGFAVIDSILEAGALVQCAVAAKTVGAAGTYDVTWTATPVQGAQLWLVAVQ